MEGRGKGGQFYLFIFLMGRRRGRKGKKRSFFHCVMFNRVTRCVFTGLSAGAESLGRGEKKGKERKRKILNHPLKLVVRCAERFLNINASGPPG